MSLYHLLYPDPPVGKKALKLAKSALLFQRKITATDALHYAASLLEKSTYGSPVGEFDSYKVKVKNGGFILTAYDGDRSFTEIPPSTWIDFIASSGRKGILQVDCSLFVTLVLAKAIRVYIGDQAFNERFEPELKRVFDRETRKYVSLNCYEVSKITFSSFSFRNQIPPEQERSFQNSSTDQEKAKQALKKAKPGTIITYAAVDKTKVDKDYKYENAILIGDDQYAAHGLTEYLFSLEELRQTLDDDVAAGKTTYYISHIAFYDLNRYKKSEK